MNSYARIAVVAANGRFPGAKDCQKLWENALSGDIALHHICASDTPLADADNATGGYYVPVKGILEGAEDFDPFAFEYSPGEARLIDPQQRLFLECALSTLELGAVDSERFNGRIGVFGGQFISTYLLNNLIKQGEVNATNMSTVFQGNTVDQLAARVAYKLNLRGPAITIQAACATSLAAVHMACESLRRYECDAALAGGVSVSFPTKAGYFYEEGGFLSASGACRPFDHRADGTVFGDGVGMVMLRRFEDAFADGDPIRAVILSSAMNNDGASKVAYSSPSAIGQAEVCAEALELSGVPSSTVGYIETHGSGTQIGDAIEMEALRSAYEMGVDGKPIYIGAVKANVGHLEAAAGVTGLIRAIYALESGKIPPIAGFEKLNPKIANEGTRFIFPSAETVWSKIDGPRRAAVSAFGVGGTNVHVILEQSRVTPEPSHIGDKIFPVSSATRTSLAETCKKIADFIEQGSESLSGVQSSLCLGRRERPWRAAIVASDKGEVVSKLRTAAIQEARPNRKVVFIFPGENWIIGGAGRSLYNGEDLFRKHLEVLSDKIASRYGIDARRLVLDGDQQGMTEPEAAHLISFVVPVAIVYWLRDLGVVPTAVIGYGLGEIGAALIAEMLSLDEALSLVVARGRLIATTPVGAMLAIPFGETDALALMGQELDLAAISGPKTTVVSGSIDAIGALSSKLASEKHRCTPLPGTRAYYSRSMDNILNKWRDHIKSVRLCAPGIPFYSSLVGARLDGADAISADYWVKQLRGSVRFAKALESYDARDGDVFLELVQNGGPSKMVNDTIEHRGKSMPYFSFVGTEDANSDWHRESLDSLARLWSLGVSVKIPTRSEVRRVPVPPTAFQPSRLFVETVTDDTGKSGRTIAHTPNRTRVSALSYNSESHFLHQSAFSDVRRRWLLYLPAADAWPKLKETLENAGQVVTIVIPGNAMRRLERGVYSVRAAHEEDWIALLRDLRALVRTPTVLIHAESINTGSNRNLRTLVSAVKAFKTESTTGELTLGVITQGAFDVLGTEATDLDQSAFAAQAVVLAQEERLILVRHVDVDARDLNDAASAMALAERVFDHTTLSGALRGTRYFSQTITPLPLDPGDRSPFVRGGTYVITGGLGGLGMVLGKWLVREIDANVVAISRNPMRGAGNPNAPIPGAIQVWENDTGKGGCIIAITGNVTQPETLASIFSTISQSLGNISGVIHAAGVAGGELLCEEDASLAASISAPKTLGMQALESALNVATTKLQIPFVALCSSTAALLGGPYQGSYAAANASMDAHVRIKGREKQTKTRWISLNWDTIQDLGMTRSPTSPQTSALFDLRKLFAIDPDECGPCFCAAIAAAITYNLPQVVITRLLPREFTNGQKEIKNAYKPLRTYASRPEIGSIYEEPQTELEIRMAVLWKELLEIGNIGRNDSFIDLGGHSLTAAQLMASIRREFQIRLPVSKLFEADTIAKLSAEVESQILRELDETK